MHIKQLMPRARAHARHVSHARARNASLARVQAGSQPMLALMPLCGQRLSSPGDSSKLTMEEDKNNKVQLEGLRRKRSWTKPSHQSVVLHDKGNPRRVLQGPGQHILQARAGTVLSEGEHRVVLGANVAEAKCRDLHGVNQF